MAESAGASRSKVKVEVKATKQEASKQEGFFGLTDNWKQQAM